MPPSTGRPASSPSRRSATPLISNCTAGHHANSNSQHYHPQRAVHQVRLSALRHNYSIISSAASKQQCSVITVVKADGYGHGAIETALHLADYCGADSFAVATVDEGVTLRKALSQLNVGTSVTAVVPIPIPNQNAAVPSPTVVKKQGNIGNIFQPPASVEVAISGTGSDASSIGSMPTSVSPLPVVGPPMKIGATKKIRSPNIRILVLGPPTHLPDDFALYQQFNLELMCSGPQMARALMEWVANCDARRIQEVEKAASYQQSILLEQAMEDEDDKQMARHKKVGQASTLSNVEGVELGKELRKILLKKESMGRNSGHGSDHMSSTATSTRGSMVGTVDANGQQQPVSQAAVPVMPFKGIEDAAKASRVREMAAAKVLAQTAGEEDEDDDDTSLEGSDHNNDVNDQASSIAHENDAEDSAVVSAVCSAAVKDASAKISSSTMKKGVAPATARRKIKWHALVDSGMGRLGFKSVEDKDGDEEEVGIPLDKLPAPLQAHTKKNAKWKIGPHRDTVSIIKAMTDAEIFAGAPIEFFGMCTHMAEASAESDFTNEQMVRFKSLLNRVRQAGISVPTISTDNSSALLTTNLIHFNPAELLVQKNVTNSLGYVRTGGGIFGQRPAFPLLKSVSTLSASVRHVAIVPEGQSVGYDRAYIAPKNVRIGTVTIGFADGYPRDLGNGRGCVSIRGAVFPIAGNVCMDMLMVDLGPAEDVDGIGAKVVVGDRAVLWGPEHDGDSEGTIRLQDLAQKLKTTQSALTCGLNRARVQRQYVE